MRLPTMHGDRVLLDSFQRELDEVEKTWPMINEFERIDPYVIYVDEAGLRFRFIVYNKQSQQWYGTFRAEQTWALPHVSTLKVPETGDVVFDLGANNGFMAVWYALTVGPEGVVHAFDPCPWHVVSCRYQAELNYLKNLYAHPVGVGAQDGTIRVPLAASQTTRSFEPEGDDYREITIHALGRYSNLNPTFMKIDIEGAEADITSELPKFQNLKAIQLELHPVFIREQGQEPAEVVQAIMSMGFTVLAGNAYDPPLSEMTIVDDQTQYFCVRPQHHAVIKKLRTTPVLHYFIDSARLHLLRGEIEAAKGFASQAVEHYPEQALAHKRLAEVAVAERNLELAALSAERAKNICPDDHSLHFYSWILSQMGRREEAVAVARDAIKKNPDVGAYHYHLSYQLAALGNKDQAIASAELAQRLEPKNEFYSVHLETLRAQISSVESADP